MLSYTLFGLACLALVAWVWRNLYPKPYPGIPYNKASANRIAGDVPDLFSAIQKTREHSGSIFTVTSQKLRTPIAQILFPNFRKPIIVLEDPRESEDILLRRNKEFDKGAMSVATFAPILPKGSLGQHTTPELKLQKRIWADVMGAEFLRKTVAPDIYKAALDLLELWRLKASAVHKDQPFSVIGDFKNAALDAIWAAVVGEKPGVTAFEIKKLRSQIAGNVLDPDEPLPRGIFVKEGVEYLEETVVRSSSSLNPTWSQKLEMLTPRYRKFRATITAEFGRVLRKAVDRYQRLEMGKLEGDDHDTCLMDLVLRRQVLEAKKTGKPLTDPTKDQSMLDEMFVMLAGGYDSTASTLTWFMRFMEAYPAVQTELRAVLKSAFPGPALPSADEILQTDIPYLDAACEESFRLAGTAKACVRQAVVDTTILGYRIPKGAEILINLHVDCPPVPVEESTRSATSQAAGIKRGDGFQGNAGRNLSLLEPRRWLVKDSETGKETFNPYALPSISFSGGTRGCFGRKLAVMEFRIIVVLIILSFKVLELPEDRKSTKVHEKIFREPAQPYANIRIL